MGVVDLGDRALDVVEDRHDRDPDPPLRRFGAEVGEPAVVGLRARHRVLGRHPGSAAEARSEGRRRDLPGPEHVGVGEQHLGRHTLGVEDLVAVVGVVRGEQAFIAARGLLPLGDELGVVARGLGSLEQGEHRRLMLVERLPVLGVEVLPVAGRGRPGVAVGGDDEIALHRIPPESRTTLGKCIRNS